MSNELTTTSSNLPSAGFEDAIDFEAIAREEGARDSGTFLRFNGNNGEFTFGPKDNESELPHGTQMVVDMRLLERGWICWKAGEVKDEVLVPVTKGAPPEEDDLPDHGPYEQADDDGQGDGWKKQMKLPMWLWALPSGADDVAPVGKDFVFKPSNNTPRRSLANLLVDYGKRFKQFPGKVPVLELDVSSYMPKVPGKRIGKKYAPIFKIKAWIDIAEFEALKNSGSSTDDEADDPSNYEQDAQQEQVQVVVPAANAGRRGKRF